jgi:hypothetical protein
MNYLPCVGILLAALHPVALSDEIVIYAVQSGVIDDSSCCSPTAYQNSSTTYLSATACQDFGIYGCGQSKRRVAWRFDIANAIPEGFEVNSATFTWNHPQYSSEDYCGLYIDVDDQILSSSYCTAMRTDGDMRILGHSYAGTQISYPLTSAVLDEGLAGGFVCTQISSSAWSGVSYINAGTVAPRIVLEGVIDSPVGACCLLSSDFCAQLPRHICENGQNTIFHGAGSICAEGSTCPSDDCGGDVQGDGVVNVEDLLGVISRWGPCIACDEDLNADGAVDVLDLMTILDGWGQCD